MIEIKSVLELLKFLDAHKLAVLKFSSEFCGPCRAIEPQVQRLEKETPQVTFASIDLAEVYALAEEFDVQSAPTFVYFKAGEEVSRVVGAKVPEITEHLEALVAGRSEGAADEGEGAASEAGEGAGAAGPATLNAHINKQQLEVLNVGTTGSDLFGSGQAATVTDADSQLLAFVPFQSRASVQSIRIKVAETEQRPAHIKVFASLVSVLSFEDAASHKALVDQDLGEPNADGWIEVGLRQVHFQNVSSLVLFITGEDDDEPTAIQQILLVGTVREKLQGSVHDEE